MTLYMESGAAVVVRSKKIERRSSVCDTECQRSHGGMLLVQDGPKDIFVDLCPDRPGAYRLFCGCKGVTRTQMEPRRNLDIPVSDGVEEHLTCPACQHVPTFSF